MVIEVRSIIDAADTGEQGARLFPYLLEAISFGDGAIVSFDGIETATSSFTNELFVKLLDHAPLADIKRKFRIVASTKQINSMIRSLLERKALHDA